VKEAGGTVIVQNPETASYPGMPLSLAPSTVDVVADLESIGPLLQNLVTGANVPPSPEQNQRMQTLMEQLRARSGIDFSQYRQPTIQRRLQRRLADTGVASLEDYLLFLKSNPDEYQRLASSFLIKVTDFFRDTDLFAYLRERVIPELVGAVDDRRASWDSDSDGGGSQIRRKELRVWSAGCATGEEAYSLAIIIAEALGDELPKYDVRIFATDLDAEAVSFGRRGVYPAPALRNLSEEQIERYFTQVDGAYEVRRVIRKLVVFGQHDLGQRPPFPHLDLALCRNVLIYFTPELQRRALHLFAFSLRNGGRLVLGKSETTSPLPEYFMLEHARFKVFRREGERAYVPPARLHSLTPSPTTPETAQTSMVPQPRPVLARTALGGAQIPGARWAPQTSGERAERLMLDLPVGIVVIDRRYDVQAINAMARQLLGIHTTAVGDDIVHLTQRLAPDRLREGIDRALRGHPSVERFEVHAAGPTADEVRTLELGFHPQPSAGGAAIDRVTIVATDITAPLQTTREIADGAAHQRALLDSLDAQAEALAGQAAQHPDVAGVLPGAREAIVAARAEIERLTAAATELDRVRGQLLSANAELTTGNAELRNLNDDLLVGNEESQAAVEEIETLAEEQQASNEELETLNEELQSTVEELNTTNEDLEARGVELQLSATALASERGRLAAVLSGMADAVLVIDQHGRTVLTNAAFDTIFGSQGASFVPHDDAGRPLPPEEAPQRRAARGEQFSMQFTWTEPGADSPRWFEATTQPANREHQDGGGVMVIRDISERSLLRLQEQFVSMASHELRTPLTSLMGYLQMLTRPQQAGPDGAATDRTQHYPAMALDQARRINRLVDDLLDVTRLRRGAMRYAFEDMDVVAALERAISAVQIIEPGRTIALTVDSPGTPLVVSGDAFRLEQVFLNILSNAFKHAPDSERVEVRVSRVPGSAVTEAGRASEAQAAHAAQAAQAAQAVEVEVTDTGPGIAAADLPHIFSRFFQVEPHAVRAEQGLGLGLYISKEIVTAHSGAITGRSLQGEGTTIVIRLPLLEG